MSSSANRPSNITRNRGHDYLLELGLVHHLARVEAGVHQLTAEGRGVSALVRHEADGRLLTREHSAAVPEGERFVVSWRVPLTRRDQPGKPD